MWLDSLVIRTLDWRLDSREFDSRPPRLTLGRDKPHFGISSSNADQLSLLDSAIREMRTSQSAVTLCGWRVEEVWFMALG